MPKAKGRPSSNIRALFLFIRKPSHKSFTAISMAPHSNTLAWRIPWMEEPGRLPSMGSLRVGHDSVTSLSLFTFMHWRRKWQPTPLFLPGESQGRGSLVGCHLWGRTELDTTEANEQQTPRERGVSCYGCPLRVSTKTLTGPGATLGCSPTRIYLNFTWNGSLFWFCCKSYVGYLRAVGFRALNVCWMTTKDA